MVVSDVSLGEPQSRLPLPTADRFVICSGLGISRHGALSLDWVRVLTGRSCPSAQPAITTWSLCSGDNIFCCRLLLGTLERLGLLLELDALLVGRTETKQSVLPEEIVQSGEEQNSVFRIQGYLSLTCRQSDVVRSAWLCSTEGSRQNAGGKFHSSGAKAGLPFDTVPWEAAPVPSTAWLELRGKSRLTSRTSLLCGRAKRPEQVGFGSFDFGVIHAEKVDLHVIVSTACPGNATEASDPPRHLPFRLAHTGLPQTS